MSFHSTPPARPTLQAATRPAGDPGTPVPGLSEAELAGLIGSRLCHDLISPLGAIGNGVELLGLTGEYPGLAASPELQLIAQSVEAARGRIRVFRVAFGQAAADQRLSRSEIATIISDVEAAGRLKVAFQPESDHPKGQIKMILLALMCMETAMPWGGRVVVAQAEDRWRLVGESQRVKADQALWHWLGHQTPTDEARVPPQPTAAEVHFPTLAAEAAHQGRKIAWELDEQGAEISF
ncbi:histidine phosphotransferase family protein [Paracoccus pacificus]|uniref:Histidine phosphotransferase family protein n=1 Tax=Paracoccus pacificus TaxID=1463598 RepID=A0ABW4RAF8_9RHOB